MIETPLLFFSLFFPRISLLVAYLMNSIPLNPVPFWGDVVLSVFVPRVLMLIYIYGALGIESGWFWAHVVAMILVYGSGTRYSSSN